jgi:hypothetical protein
VPLFGYFNWHYGPPDFLRANELWNVREAAPGGNRLAAFDSHPHTFSCQVGDVGHRVLVGIPVCGKVSKIGDAGNESAIIFAAVLVAREP